MNTVGQEHVQIRKTMNSRKANRVAVIASALALSTASTSAFAGSDTAAASVQIVKGIAVTAEQDLQFGAILNGLQNGTDEITLQADGSFTGSGTDLSSVNDSVDGTQLVQAATFSVESEDAQSKSGQTITVDVSQDFSENGNGGTAPSLTALQVSYGPNGSVSGSGTTVDITSADIPANATSNLQVGATLEVSAGTTAGTYDDAEITVTSNFQ
ncbi:DUF4402 domain-containing protein [Spiribacter pallidus]|uniref:DUF4402 domain-containing protein n=1 Tax=Spiribacter pallidus TaxID=1987936 RepID=UPI00349F381C